MLELAVVGNDDASVVGLAVKTLVMMLMTTLKVITIVTTIRYYGDIVITIMIYVNIMIPRTAVASTVWF